MSSFAKHRLRALRYLKENYQRKRFESNLVEQKVGKFDKKSFGHTFVLRHFIISAFEPQLLLLSASSTFTVLCQTNFVPKFPVDNWLDNYQHETAIEYSFVR